MTVKIFIKRKVSPANVLDLTVLLKKLRSLTLNQAGYIYGETLKRVPLSGVGAPRSRDFFIPVFKNQLYRTRSFVVQLSPYFPFFATLSYSQFYATGDQIMTFNQKDLDFPFALLV